MLSRSEDAISETLNFKIFRGSIPWTPVILPPPPPINLTLLRNWCYRVLHIVTQCYTVLHGVTRCYTVLHGVQGCYVVSHGVTRCYKVKGCYMVLQGLIYTILYGVTRC